MRLLEVDLVRYGGGLGAGVLVVGMWDSCVVTQHRFLLKIEGHLLGLLYLRCRLGQNTICFCKAAPWTDNKACKAWKKSSGLDMDQVGMMPSYSCQS